MDTTPFSFYLLVFLTAVAVALAILVAIKDRKNKK
jgi:hypothetical protein